ncbi:malate dehydrogenase [Mycena venus]|uniref:Malate dehydrogenase n=1 Tax=Mycena venus TaxID=2733690 RepID=A0A8H6X8Q6_9AGAR|nr:malate dehydrogenase [Mycena venus]
MTVFSNVTPTYSQSTQRRHSIDQMLALALIPLLLSAVSAVERRANASRCDISGATLSLPSNQTLLTAPSQGPSYIGVAIGTQNYTCNATTGTYINVGAVAQLFDASCLYDSPEFSSLQEIAYTMWKYAPPTASISQVIEYLQPFHASFVLGQHYFVPSPSGPGVSPKWDFSSAALAGHPDAYVLAAKAGDIPAPTGPPNVDWLSLNKVEGNLATQVFRVNTVGGLPPASCTAGSPPIAVKYASTYWLYGSSVQQ